MIQLLGSIGIGVGAVGGSGARSPTMPPDSPVNSNRSSSVAGVTPPGCEDAVVAVDLAHHAVAETIRGGRELDRHVRRLLEAVEAAALVRGSSRRCPSR